MTNDEQQRYEAACHALAVEQDRGTYVLAEHTERMRPSNLYRPALSVDGNQWCALYGEDLMRGVAGFGDSPALAYEAFDREWVKPLAAPSEVK